MTYSFHMAQAAEVATQSSTLFWTLPFDMARQHYASAVRVGLIEPSMLAGAQFERNLSSLERATLGPWARHV